MTDANLGTGGLDVRHEEGGGRGAFYVERGGERVAELTYARVRRDLVVIEHTEVSDALQGQGVARKLVDAAVAWARASGTRFELRCTYARSVFDRDASLRDVLA